MIDATNPDRIVPIGDEDLKEAVWFLLGFNAAIRGCESIVMTRIDIDSQDYKDALLFAQHVAQIPGDISDYGRFAVEDMVSEIMFEFGDDEVPF